MGLVPIVVNYGGPGELVDPATGIRIPISDRERIIKDLQQALQKISEDPEMLRPLAAAARERVMNEFTWQAKAAQMVRIWQAVLAGQPFSQQDAAQSLGPVGMPQGL